MTPRPSRIARLLGISVIGLGLGAAGCGEADDSTASPEVTAVAEPIVGGGNEISIDTRRLKGLVTVGGCSGALLTPDAVLTAGHCIQWSDIHQQMVSSPRPDGQSDTRPAYAGIQVGTTDMAILKLEPIKTGMQWPLKYNFISPVSEANYINKQVSFYGGGASTYVGGGGVTGWGVWKTYRPIIESVVSDNYGMFLGDAYKLVSQFNPNYEGAAWGDSGGPVFDDFNGGIVGVETNIGCYSWKGQGLLGDPGCSANTIIEVGPTYARPTGPLSSFISEIINRQNGEYTFQPLSLANNWTGSPYGTHWPAVAGTQPGPVALRGAMNIGSASVAFTLPPPFRPNGIVYAPVVTANATIGRLVISPDGTTTVQSEGLSYADSNAGGFTSLDGVMFDTDQASYTPLSLTAGWSGAPYGTRAPAVKTLSGVVYLQGGMMTSGTNNLAFTLPLEARPATPIWLPVGLCWGHKGRLAIATNGEVRVAAEGGAWANAQCFVSLEGVSFLKPGGAPVTVMTPAGSWKAFAFGGSQAGVRDDFGIIRLQGSISGGTSNYLFQLPAGMHPSVNIYLYADAYGGARARIMVTPDGAVRVEQGLTAAESFISLDGLWFAI